jgi:hypothetical protein
MPFSPVAGGDFHRALRRRELLMLFVILALTACLVTRYAYVSSVPYVTKVKSGSTTAQRQHLQKDAVQWVGPADEFILFLIVAGCHPPEPQQPLLVVHLDESLYNRPPPAELLSV